MKRFIAIVLITVLMMNCLICISIAESKTSEDTAHEIFDSLANIYDASLYYLNQRQTTWDKILAAKSSDVTKYWFDKNILIVTNHERGVDIYSFTLVNDYIDPYEDLFVPLFDYYGHTDEGLQKAAFTYIVMIFYDGDTVKKLEAQKDAIKSLKNADPDYEYIKELQELYKKTSQVVDYAKSGSDSYINTSSRISDYEQIRREQKSEFDFVFDWPEFTYNALNMNPVFGSIIQAYHEAKEADLARPRRIESTKTVNYYKKSISSVTTAVYTYNADNSGTIVITNYDGNTNDVKRTLTIKFDSSGHYISGQEEGAWAKPNSGKWSKSSDRYITSIEYDENNNPLKETKTYKAGKNALHPTVNGTVEVSNYINSYDEYGNLIKSIEKREGKKDYILTYKNTLNGEGQIIKSERQASNSDKVTPITYEYDEEYGLLIRQVYGNERGESYTVITYKYEVAD